MTFAKLGIDQKTIERLAEKGITIPSEIQEHAIPAILDGRDVLAESETGSGKTLAFGLPMLETLQHEHDIVQALVVCPTRELAKQVAGEFEKFGAGLTYLTVYGGVSLEPQMAALPDTDIVIGTPGRLLDLSERGALKLDKVCYLVLDEADKMFDMGFIEDIERIIKLTPEERQTLLFSATISYRIKKLSEKYMNQPVELRAKSQEVRGNLVQGYYVVNPFQKISLLYHLVKKQNRALVFCRTKVATDHVAAELSKRGVKAQAMHGDLTQAKREQTVKDFSDGTFQVLIATDVAARGLHIDNITHVYNYDLPDEPDTYVHRVGRTARQGADGDAITLLAEDDYRKFDGIMNLYDDEIEKMTYHAWGQLERIPPSPPRDHSRGASRGPPRGGPRRSGPSHGPRKSAARRPPRR